MTGDVISLLLLVVLLLGGVLFWKMAT